MKLSKADWDRLWRAIKGKRKPQNDDWYFKKAPQ
jgi:hypothetical protein